MVLKKNTAIETKKERMQNRHTIQDLLYFWVFDESDLLDIPFRNSDIQKSPVLDGYADRTKLDYSMQVINRMIEGDLLEKLPRFFYKIK